MSCRMALTSNINPHTAGATNTLTYFQSTVMKIAKSYREQISNMTVDFSVDNVLVCTWTNSIWIYDYTKTLRVQTKCCLTRFTLSSLMKILLDTRRLGLTHIQLRSRSAEPGTEWAGVRTFRNCPRFSEHWNVFKQMIQTQLSKFARMWSWLGAHTFRWLFPCLRNLHKFKVRAHQNYPRWRKTFVLGIYPDPVMTGLPLTNRIMFRLYENVGKNPTV